MLALAVREHRSQVGRAHGRSGGWRAPSSASPFSLGSTRTTSDRCWRSSCCWWGLRILIRFSSPVTTRVHDGVGPPSFEVHGVTVAATAGGVTNGSGRGLGPVVTPFLLHPRPAPALRDRIGQHRRGGGCGRRGPGRSSRRSAATGSRAAPSWPCSSVGSSPAPWPCWLIRFVPVRLLGLAVAALLLLTNGPRARRPARHRRGPLDRLRRGRRGRRPCRVIRRGSPPGAVRPSPVDLEELGVEPA